MNIETEGKGNCDIVRLDGQLTMGQEDEFKKALSELAASNSVQLVIDLSKVDFMDSAGLGMLIWALKNFRQRDGDVRVFGLQGMVQGLFEITNMDQSFKTFEDEAEAVASYG